MAVNDGLKAEDLEARTERLNLTLIGQKDADELFRILNDPDLHQFTGGAPLTFGELRRRIATWESLQSPDGEEVWLNWTVRLAATGAAIGYVQASIRNRVASIAYVIGSAQSGQGFATEATLAMCRVLEERLSVEGLVAHIHPMHRASQQVAHHIGLVRTGGTDADGEELWERPEQASSVSLGRFRDVMTLGALGRRSS